MKLLKFLLHSILHLFLIKQALIIYFLMTLAKKIFYINKLETWTLIANPLIIYMGMVLWLSGPMCLRSRPKSRRTGDKTKV